MNYRSDLMDRFLDVYDTDDLHYGTTSVYAEVKKENGHCHTVYILTTLI